LYGAKYPRACECLSKDKEDLFPFYDFPAEHSIHIRTTNPIESTPVRLRTKRTKGCGSGTATLTMVYKRAEQTEKHWRGMNGHALILKVPKPRTGISTPLFSLKVLLIFLDYLLTCCVRNKAVSI
jgi:hypothetical protein